MGDSYSNIKWVLWILQVVSHFLVKRLIFVACNRASIFKSNIKNIQQYQFIGIIIVLILEVVLLCDNSILQL